MYIGSIKDKLVLQVKVTNIYNYTKEGFGYWPENHSIYIMEDAEHNVFKWDTTSSMHCGETNDGHNILVNKGDVIKIKGTVKDHKEYKGSEQTVLTRVVAIEILVRYEEVKKQKQEEQKQEQVLTLKDGDFIWEMPYKQYKEHYSDCETVVGSFKEADRRGVATIKVIIRNGRLKNSGVRGKHYSGYEFKDETGAIVCYRAVSEENALKRANKEFPNRTWELNKIYRYNS